MTIEEITKGQRDAIESVANVIGAYYAALLANGIPAEFAEKLTNAYHTTVLAKLSSTPSTQDEKT